MSERVVITGMGVVTPIGNDLETFWTNLVAGESGVVRVTDFDLTGYATQIAGTVKGFDPEMWVDAREARRLDRTILFAVAAAKMALRHAELDPGAWDPERVGVVIGSGVGGMGTLEDNFSAFFSRGPRRVSPFFVPMMIANMPAGYVAIELGARGPNFAPVSACATGTHALGLAYELLKANKADVVFAGGAEAAVRPIAFAAFGAARALSTRNDDPPRASRPFDRRRDGFVIGEGAGVLVLERLSVARARGAPILAEVVGFGMSADAYHITAPAPEGRGMAEAMRHALADANLPPEAVDYVNAHGTATEYNDRCETKAIKTVFGEHAYRLLVSSNKSMIGHLLGAAGAVEAAATVMTLRTGIVPPTINLEEPDPELDLDYVPNVARRADVRVALSNSFGFGGQNAVLALRRYDEGDERPEGDGANGADKGSEEEAR